MLAEKSRIAEEEASLLNQKASEAERESELIRQTAIRTEEEKVLMEQKMRETEQIVARIMAESDTRTMEADKLKNELLKARLAEKEAKEKLLQFLSQPALEHANVSALLSMNVRTNKSRFYLTVPSFTDLK